MRVAREEIFGPVLSVLKVGSYEEAVSVANDVKYGLSSALYTRDVGRAFRAMRDLDAGIIVSGTRGNSGLRGLLSSSTADAVLKHAGRPVLIVPPEK